MTFIRIIITGLLLTGGHLWAQTKNTTAGDSATIVFENVSGHSLWLIRAVVQSKYVAYYNVGPGQRCPAFKVSLKDKPLFRFSVYKEEGTDDRNTIEPMDYPYQVSSKSLKLGTYIYYIKDEENSLDVKLKKLK